MPEPVAPEMIGREASARLLIPFFEAAERKGMSAEALAEGTGYRPAQLQNSRERVAWSAFMQVLANLGRVSTDEELLELGASIIGKPIHRALVLPGRLMFSLRDLYRWGASNDGPLAQLIAAQEFHLTEVGDRRLRLDTLNRPGYTAVPEFWTLRLGFLRGIPRAFGLPNAEVSLTMLPDGARYEIELPEDTSLVNRVRQRASWLFAARSAAGELRKANDDLHARYIELQREVDKRKAAEEELRELNAQLEKRVAERTQDLERANRNLAASNEELTLFSHSVAHDLRAPLRAINGFATALLEDYAPALDDEARRHITRVVDGAVRMGSLIDALLSLSRITRADIRREKFDLAEIARSVLEEMRAIEPERVVETRIEASLEVEGDPVLVRALLQNLIGNAWKFTRDREGAWIEVARIRREPRDVFRVRDNGVGFDMRHVKSLFAPFYRLHTTKAFEGTGIGLAIADRIVRRHGGTIAAEGAPDAGASFEFSLGGRAL